MKFRRPRLIFPGQRIGKIVYARTVRVPSLIQVRCDNYVDKKAWVYLVLRTSYFVHDRKNDRRKQLNMMIVSYADLFPKTLR
jgi:hypothetical protein